MKLIGKQIMVELPDKKYCGFHKDNSEWFVAQAGKSCEYCFACKTRNDALSEVAKMNPALEVDVEMLKDTIRPIFDKFREIPYEESRMSLMLTCRHIDILTNDIAHALASNPSAWLKRKE